MTVFGGVKLLGPSANDRGADGRQHVRPGSGACRGDAPALFALAGTANGAALVASVIAGVLVLVRRSPVGAPEVEESPPVPSSVLPPSGAGGSGGSTPSHVA